MNAYILHHCHTMDDESEDVKLLGVYSSKDVAEAAIVRFRERPGFRKSQEGFSIDEYTIDRDYWTEGYVSGNDAF